MIKIRLQPTHKYTPLPQNLQFDFLMLSSSFVAKGRKQVYIFSGLAGLPFSPVFICSDYVGNKSQNQNPFAVMFDGREQTSLVFISSAL